MMPPEKMLPKSRSASVNGLTSSSIRLIGNSARVGLEVVLEVALPALLADAEDVHADDHQEGHRIGEVDVGGWRGQQVHVVVELAREHFDPVRRSG